MLQVGAKVFTEIKIEEFKASDGWMHNSKGFNIEYYTLSGEAGSIVKNAEGEWRKLLPSLCNGYAALIKK